MKHLLIATLLFCLPALGGQPISTNSDEQIKMNQIQIIASHNSYHLRTDKEMLRFLKQLYHLHILPKSENPEGIDYTNASLTDQLEKYHVRGLELDVWNDPDGGRFYRRMGRLYMLRKTKSHVEELTQPGFKLLHIPDFDYNTTNYTFVSALKEIKAWSDAHPLHLPIFINIETEAETVGDRIKKLKKLTKSAAFDSKAANDLDNEVKSVFGEDLKNVITPEKVQGSYATLEQAVLNGNWPTIATARGKVVFIIDGDGESSTVYKTYHPSLKGRAMFVYTEPGTEEAAFVKRNGAVNEFADIQKLVAKGYIVRTRSDEGTVAARTGDRTGAEKALASWAQIVSTDYYRPDARAGKKGWTDYKVSLPNDQVARMDSISTSGKKDNLKE